MQYSINTLTGEIADGDLGASFRTGDWRECTEEEIVNFELEKAQEQKCREAEELIDQNMTITIQAQDYQIFNDAKTRNLLLAKIVVLQNKIDSNLITEAEATFLFKINKTEKVNLAIVEIREVVTLLDDERQSQFDECQTTQENIRNLTSIIQVEEYPIDQ